MNYWLMKSSPSTYSFDDLLAAENKTTAWEGVRNYQVRNMMRDQMACGDQAFFYQSSCPEPGVVGIVRVVKAAYPDHFAFDKASPYFDAKSDPNNPRWIMVDVQAVRPLRQIVSLATLRQQQTKSVSELLLLKKGCRLSITPVTKAQWTGVLALEK